MKKFVSVLAALSIASMVAAPVADAGRFGGGSSSRSSCCKSSGGSKPSSSSKSSSYSKPKVATASKPSTGSKAQRAPVTRLVPPTPSPRIPVSNPRVTQAFGQGTRSYSADRTFLTSNPKYADPYLRRNYGDPYIGYYGYYDSPLFYMWAYGMFNDNNDRPLPPEVDGAEVSEAIVSYLGLIDSERKALDQ